jgi:hypothetical protein
MFHCGLYGRHLTTEKTLNIQSTNANSELDVERWTLNVRR